jgi:hypothetical protein
MVVFEECGNRSAAAKSSHTPHGKETTMNPWINRIAWTCGFVTAATLVAAAGPAGADALNCGVSHRPRL